MAKSGAERTAAWRARKAEGSELVQRAGDALNAARRRFDGWMNFVTGLGTWGRDKRMATHLAPRQLGFEELSDLYRFDWLAGRIVNARPDEMLRRGFEIRINNDLLASTAMNRALDALNAPTRLHESLIWSGAMGGAGMLLGTDDELSKTGGLREPLDLDRVDSIDVLTVLDARELVPLTYYDSPFDPKYGYVRTYRAQPLFGTQSGSSFREIQALFEVHESRVIRFEGNAVQRRFIQQNLGWGDSVLQRPYDVIRDFNLSWQSASALLQDFGQGVFKMKGVAEAFAGGEAHLVQARIAGLDYSRSVLRSLLLDEGEEFERKATPMGGLPETLQFLCNIVAASSNIPVTVLMGMAPAGLNATGASDVQLWYDSCATDRIKRLEPQIRRLCEVLFRSKKGPTQGKLPQDWTIYWPPLVQLNELQEAQRRLTIAQADQINVGLKAITAQEVRSHFVGAEFNPEIQLARDSQEAVAAAAGGGPSHAPDPEASRPTPAAVAAPRPGLPVAVGSTLDPKADAGEALPDRRNGDRTDWRDAPWLEELRDWHGRWASFFSQVLPDPDLTKIPTDKAPTLTSPKRKAEVLTAIKTYGNEAILAAFPKTSQKPKLSLVGQLPVDPRKHLRARGMLLRTDPEHPNGPPWSVIVLATEEPRFGETLAPGKTETLALTGRTEDEGIAITATHEIAHFLWEHADDIHPGLQQQIADLTRQTRPTRTPLVSAHPGTRDPNDPTNGARDADGDYFAQCVAAYMYCPKQLQQYDSVGYELVEKVFALAGVKVPPPDERTRPLPRPPGF